MRRGTESLNQNRMDDAVASFKAALLLRPQSVDALNGLAGSYMKAATPALAVPSYRSLVKLQPQSVEAWRGLFAAELQANQPADALATERELPSAVRAQLQRDPAYLRSMIVALRSVGRDADAQALLDRALTQDLPDSGRGLKPELRLHYAGLLADAKRYAQAATMYRELLYDDPAPVGSVFAIGDNKKWWAQALKDAKIENFRWHDLRHTFCSRLAQKGVGLKVIQEAAGHKTISMSARYAHMDQTSLRSALAVLNRSV